MIYGNFYDIKASHVVDPPLVVLCSAIYSNYLHSIAVE